MNNGNFIGKEVIYIVFMAAVSAVTEFIQMIFAIDTGEIDTGLFGGTIYEYNLIFYILGIVIYFTAMIWGYKHFLKQEMEKVKELKLWAKILFYFVIALYVFITKMEELCVFMAFWVIKDSLNLEPDILSAFLMFGWPVVFFVFMTAMFIKNHIKHE